MDDIQCIFCGDSCGERICYGCQDTADTMGLNIDELMEVV